MESLIFVALAVAWAIYLVPRALEHHDAGRAKRSISTFSERLRVLARREAASRRRSKLIKAKTATPVVAALPTAESSSVTAHETARTVVPVFAAAAGSVTVTVTESLSSSLPIAVGQNTPIEIGRPMIEVVAHAADFTHSGSGYSQSSHSESILETTQSGRLHLPAYRPSRPVSQGAGALAAQRRRRVLGALGFLFAATAALTLGQVIPGWWLTLPGALIIAWLAACRAAVRTARGAVRRVGTPRAVPKPRQAAPAGASFAPPAAPVEEHAEFAEAAPEAAEPIEEPTEEPVNISDDETSTIPAISEELEIIAETAPELGGTWEPAYAPLPMYVSKPSAPRRSVSIDLDSTGVWTSGRSEIDSALAREAEAARSQQSPANEGAAKRVSGA